MRSRIIVARPLILSYGFDEVSLGMLDDISKGLNITHKAVGDDKAGEKIGYLCGFKGFESSGTKVSMNDKRCLVFSGIKRQELDGLLKKLREEKLNVSLKAMVTPSNQSWTFADLMNELEKEHEYMTRRNK